MPKLPSRLNLDIVSTQGKSQAQRKGGTAAGELQECCIATDWSPQFGRSAGTCSKLCNRMIAETGCWGH